MRIVRVLAFGLCCLFSSAAVAQANTLTVGTTSDSLVPASGSLRDTISRANPGDTVALPESTSHYDVNLGEITINKPLTISGSDPGLAIIDAHGSSRVFHVTAAPGSESTVRFQNVTVTGGRTSSPPGGGGILVDPSLAAPVDLSLVGAVVNANSATVTSSSPSAGGGGIYGSGGGITLQGSTVSDNTATVTGNHCCHGGGGIYNNGPSGRAPLVVSRSHLTGDSFTLHGNPADLSGSSSNCCSGGGALYQNSDSDATVDGSQLTGNSATITSGQCCHGGGAVFLDYGRTSNDATTLTGSNFDNNTATVNGPTAASGSRVAHCCSGGGALASFLGFTSTGSTMNGNTANVNSGDCCNGGGAAQIHNQRQSIALYGTSLSNNTTTMNSSACCNGGGAIQYDASSGSPGPLSARGSAIAGNTASFTGGAAPSTSGGGGIYEASPGGDSFTNSTIADNATNAPGSGQGGGGLIMQNRPGAPDTFANATVSGNSASAGSGDAVLSQGSTVQSKNSIFARNGAGAGGGCAARGGGFSSLGYNLEDGPDTCGLSGTGDQVVSTATLGLGGLAANNGPTPSDALLPGSPAIDAGDPAGCTDPSGALLETDQRGYPRPSGPRCDIGAFELQQPHQARPRCKVTPAGRAVRLVRSRATRPRNPGGARLRAVSAFLNCDQPATVRVKALFRVGKKPRRAKRFGTRGVVVVSVRAHVRKRVTVKLPLRAVKALEAHAKLLCHLLLVVSNGNGTRYQSVQVGYLVVAS